TGKRANGQTGKRANGQTGKRANGQTGRRANGQTGRRANGQTGRRANGQTGRRANGLLVLYEVAEVLPYQGRARVPGADDGEDGNEAEDGAQGVHRRGGPGWRLHALLPLHHAPEADCDEGEDDADITGQLAVLRVVAEVGASTGGACGIA